MAGTTRQKAISGPGAGLQPLHKLARKIVLVAGDAGLELSDRRTLLEATNMLAREVVIIAPPEHRAEVEALGASAVEFDWCAASSSPVSGVLAAWKLARILEAENADAVHLIGVRSAALGALALKLITAKNIIVHLPHLGGLEPASGILERFYRPSPAKLVASLLRTPSSFLLLEDDGDLTSLRARGIEPGARFAVLGGDGVDPDAYPVLPPPAGEIPIAACVGRMVASSGVDVLMRAFDRVWARGVRLQLELVGGHAAGASDAISPEDIAQWGLHPGVRRTEPVPDVREVWRRAGICVLPASGRQGLPRSLLEAAACGRALIVTNNAGGGSFVRHEVEGLVTPPGDVGALAQALERLARDAELRTRLGQAARLRILQGYTEPHVEQALHNAYIALLGAPRSS